MIKITSLQQINELVAEQLGWQLVTIKSDYDDYTSDVTKWFPQEIDEDEVEQWLHDKCEEGYSYYDYVPNFASDPWWNNKIVDYLVKKELVITTEISSIKMYPFGGYIICKIKDIKLRGCSPLEENWEGYIKGECALHNTPPHTLQLAVCLAFLNYKIKEVIKFNDVNNS